MYQIKNPVILDEYIKVASFKLDVSQTILKTQIMNKQSEMFGVIENSDRVIVKKTYDNPSDAMEENLIKLVFSAHDDAKLHYIKEKLKDYSSSSKILSTIEKRLDGVNNIDELAKKLFLEFYNEQDIQNQISDDIFSSHEFDNLSIEDYCRAVDETLLRINRLAENSRKDELKKMLRNDAISEQEKLKILQSISKN